jgi:hypothetical protein
MTDPKGLHHIADPVGPDNDRVIQRKAEARSALDELVERIACCPVCGNTNLPVRKMLEGKRDTYARACIDEAVAPALAYLQGAIDFRKRDVLPTIVLSELRKLLTERAGT